MKKFCIIVLIVIFVLTSSAMADDFLNSETIHINTKTIVNSVQDRMQSSFDMVNTFNNEIQLKILINDERLILPGDNEFTRNVFSLLDRNSFPQLPTKDTQNVSVNSKVLIQR